MNIGLLLLQEEESLDSSSHLHGGNPSQSSNNNSLLSSLMTPNHKDLSLLQCRLHNASKSGMIESIRILISEGAKIDYISVLYAVQHGKLNVLKLFLELKFHLNDNILYTNNSNFDQDNWKNLIIFYKNSKNNNQNFINFIENYAKSYGKNESSINNKINENTIEIKKNNSVLIENLLSSAINCGSIEILKLLLSNFLCNPIDLYPSELPPIHLIIKIAEDLRRKNIFSTYPSYLLPTSPSSSSLSASSTSSSSSSSNKNHSELFFAKLLLFYSYPPDLPDLDGITPLIYAIKKNEKGLALLLLLSGSDPSIPSPNGYTPLHFAARNDNFLLAKLLLYFISKRVSMIEDEEEKKIYHNRACNSLSSNGYSPLKIAIEKGSFSLVKLLVIWGCSHPPPLPIPHSSISSIPHPVSITSPSGAATSIASPTSSPSHERKELEEQIKEEEINKNLYSNLLHTYLLSNTIDIKGNQPCFLNIEEFFNFNEKELNLLNENIIKNLFNQHQIFHSSLDYPFLNKDIIQSYTVYDTLLIFLSKFLPLNSIEEENYDGFRPIHIACSRGNLSACCNLIQLKCNLNVLTSDSSQRSPLHLAILNGNLDIIHLLLSSGCDYNLLDVHGRGVLLTAAVRGIPNLLPSIIKFFGYKRIEEINIHNNNYLDSCTENLELNSNCNNNNENNVEKITYHITPVLFSLLLQKDYYGRSILHYSIQLNTEDLKFLLNLVLFSTDFYLDPVEMPYLISAIDSIDTFESPYNSFNNLIQLLFHSDSYGIEPLHASIGALNLSLYYQQHHTSCDVDSEDSAVEFSCSNLNAIKDAMVKIDQKQSQYNKSPLCFLQSSSRSASPTIENNNHEIDNNHSDNNSNNRSRIKEVYDLQNIIHPKFSNYSNFISNSFGFPYNLQNDSIDSNLDNEEFIKNLPIKSSSLSEIQKTLIYSSTPSSPSSLLRTKAKNIIKNDNFPTDDIVEEEEEDDDDNRYSTNIESYLKLYPPYPTQYHSSSSNIFSNRFMTNSNSNTIINSMLSDAGNSSIGQNRSRGNSFREVD